MTAGSDEPVQDFMLALVEGHGSSIATLMRSRMLKNLHKVHDDEGRFEITDVKIGKATAAVYAVGFSPGILPVQVAPDGENLPENILRLNCAYHGHNHAPGAIMCPVKRRQVLLGDGLDCFRVPVIRSRIRVLRVNDLVESQRGHFARILGADCQAG